MCASQEFIVGRADRSIHSHGCTAAIPLETAATGSSSVLPEHLHAVAKACVGLMWCELVRWQRFDTSVGSAQSRHGRQDAHVPGLKRKEKTGAFGVNLLSVNELPSGG